MFNKLMLINNDGVNFLGMVNFGLEILKFCLYIERLIDHYPSMIMSLSQASKPSSVICVVIGIISKDE